MIKSFKLFGIKFLEVETLIPEEKQQKEILKQHNPQGEVLDVLPEIKEKKDGNN